MRNLSTMAVFGQPGFSLAGMLTVQVIPQISTKQNRRITMSRIRLSLAFLLVAFLLPAMLTAQRDEGQYVILSAQYGTAEHHVDVTDRLRELARGDRPFRMGNSTFGVDPDHGRIKTLRIYARGPRGEERMFEYREGSTVDGREFRGWKRGDWGRGGDWSGNWGGGGVAQPEMTAALDNLRQAQQHLQAANNNKGGHRERAMQLIDQAISEVQQGMEFADRR
ncbi:MAG TPA: hypothetical protein VFM77_04140 [Terriglobales bacterium]|nr:hypothetical protein [Terriglobales bacterium]